MTSPPRPLRLAHRGDWRHARENTIPALLAAMDIPACDGLEFDVLLSSDGVPILLHDETLERTLGRPQRTDSLTAAALGDLGIPTLADALAAVPRRAVLDVELKDDLGPAVVEVLAAGRGPDLHGAFISSFATGALERVASLAPAWPRWLNSWRLLDDAIVAAVELGCVGISADWRDIDADSVARVRASGLRLAAWAVQRRSTAGRLERLGVEILIAEYAALDG
jgi:glycerophosphoryl diester phosphodiesterase